MFQILHSKLSAFRCKHGFTLIEMVLSLGVFAVVFALLAHNLLSGSGFRGRIREMKDLNAEASAVLGNAVAGILRSGFGIRYQETQIHYSQPDDEGFYPQGTRSEVDQLSVFTNSSRTSYATLYREPYSLEGDHADTARLMLAFSTGEVVPLHTSQVVIEEFDVNVPSDPEAGGDPETHPYANLYLRARYRYPFGETPPEGEDLQPRVSYRTSFTLRNAE